MHHWQEEFFAGWGIFGLLMVLIGLVLYVWSIIWVYRDAERRGKPGWLVALLVAFISWPISLLVWLVFRPNHTYSRS